MVASMISTALALTATGLVSEVKDPGVELKNSAYSGVIMPMMGLGTGGYGNSQVQPQGHYPECWSDGKPDPYGHVNGKDCSKAVINATVEWLKAGGRRIDNGDTYDNMVAIGKAMKLSGVPRKKIFLVSKIGSGLAMGSEDVAFQFKKMLEVYQTDYIDLVLIHWPTTGANSSTAVCNKGTGYDAKACRLDTWTGMVKAWKAKQALAIGTSNYNKDHLLEIIRAELPLPAVNQNPFNPHLATAQKSVVNFCQARGIVFNSYSPLGIPDWHKYPKSISTTGLIIEEPKIVEVAKSHNLTAAQALLSWQVQLGIPSNPRSMKLSHMKENLDAAVFSTKFSANELAVFSSFQQDSCNLAADEAAAEKNHWYECCGDLTVQPSIPLCNSQ